MGDRTADVVADPCGLVVWGSRGRLCTSPRDDSHRRRRRPPARCPRRDAPVATRENRHAELPATRPISSIRATSCRAKGRPEGFSTHREPDRRSDQPNRDDEKLRQIAAATTARDFGAFRVSGAVEIGHRVIGAVRKRRQAVPTGAGAVASRPSRGSVVTSTIRRRVVLGLAGARPSDSTRRQRQRRRWSQRFRPRGHRQSEAPTLRTPSCPAEVRSTRRRARARRHASESRGSAA